MKLSASLKSNKEKTKVPLRSIIPGDLLRLRDDVYKFIQTREWIFRRFEKDSTIFLVHESGDFGWKVRTDDVDWVAYQRSKKTRELKAKDESK